MSLTVELPRTIYAQAKPLSVGGESLFDAGVVANSALSFVSDRAVMSSAMDQLKNAGFTVLGSSNMMINISGPPSLYEEKFSCSLFAKKIVVNGAQKEQIKTTFINCEGVRKPGLIETSKTAFRESLEGVAIEEPRVLFQYIVDFIGPKEDYLYLDVPGDVSAGCNADRAHRILVTGRNVSVAMVDTGFYRHPYFRARGYRVSPVVLGPGTEHENEDENGHGTAGAANFFATAPDAELIMVKTDLANTIGGFNQAMALRPDIICCGWGDGKPDGGPSAPDLGLVAAMEHATTDGIVVVVADNGRSGFRDLLHRDVISAGGPDLTGLAGTIMLPVPPDSELGRQSRPEGPKGDKTEPGDGWATLSGTSAAAAQLAGVCALVKQAYGSLSPKGVREILEKSARNVPANDHGKDADSRLVDAYNAVRDARELFLIGSKRGVAPPRRRPSDEPHPVNELARLIPVHPRPDKDTRE